MSVGYRDGRADFEDDDCDLQLADGALVLSYWDEHGAVVFAGAEVGPGRFELVARSRPRRCTLQRDGDHTFTGSWVQGDDSGTLRIEIRGAAGAEEPR